VRRPTRVRIDEDWEEVGRPEGYAHEPGDLPPLAPWPPSETTAFDVQEPESETGPEPERARAPETPPNREPERESAGRGRRDRGTRGRGSSDAAESRLGAGPARIAEPEALPSNEGPNAAETASPEPPTGPSAPASGSFGRRVRRGR
jgi:hypothetical protein